MNEFYGIFKKIAFDNHYVSVTKALNSAATTAETKATMKPLTKPEIQYAHMGQLIIHKDVCYASFLQNPGDDSEALDSKTSSITLAVFPLARALAEDFDPEKDIEYHKLGALGRSCAGYNSISVYKCTSMCMIGDELYICFCFQCEDQRFRVFRVVYDTKSGSIGKKTAVRLLYNGELFDLTDETLNRIYEERGFKKSNSTMVEIVSRWSEYKGEYYSTFLIGGTPNNGVIVKTRDFKVMEFIDVIPHNELGSAEAGSYVKDGVMYIACRQDYYVCRMLIIAYDIENGEWYDPNYIEDGTCRPWFFEKDGDLWLINTTEEFVRRYANLSKLNDFPKWERPGVQFDTVATLFDCGFYYAVAEYQGRHFFVSSGDISHHIIRFGELKITQRDPAQVNAKLLKLFEEDQ